MAPTLRVLDPSQLKRIESTHRGFLYQHLYAAACLLKSADAGALSITIEADEDVEIVYSNHRLYLQIKTRAGPLIESDIKSALARFAQVRVEHAEGKRKGAAKFAVVSNVDPGPSLAAYRQSSDWPADIALLSPGNPPTVNGLPMAWPSISEGLTNCVELASALPFASLIPETLVWKLAGLAMHAASGEPPREDHTFQVDQLTEVFEQLVIQLQDIPAPPARYRPQDNEPELDANDRIRLIVGFSGAGKTAWISQVAQQSKAPLAYFDVGDTPETAITIPLARELAARFFRTGGGLGKIFMPGAAGSEMLRAIGNRLKSEKADPIVVIDNAHRVGAEYVRTILGVMPDVRFVLLAQPGANVQQLQTLISLKAEALRGWSADTIAAEAASNSCRADYATCEHLRRLTGGLPFYVQNAIHIAATENGGDLQGFCDELESRTHDVETALELILSRVFTALPPPVRDSVSVLSLADIPLERSEAETLLGKVFGIDEREFSRSMRELRSAGIVEVFGADRIKVHDAFRILGRRHLDTIDPAVTRNGLSALGDVLLESIVRARELSKVSLYLRVQAELGNAKPLVDIATEEIYHELGLFDQISQALESVAASPTTTPEQRFAALDGLAYGDFKRSKIEKAAERLAMMGRLIAENDLDARDRLSFEMKSMNLAALRGDVKAVFDKLEHITEVLPDEPAYQRIFRYNLAHAFLNLEEFDVCISITEKLIPEYYSVLGLTLKDVRFQTTEHTYSVLKKGIDHSDDLKHLADCLSLQAKAFNSRGTPSRFERTDAMRFYAMAHALDSFVKVGQDLVDEFMDRNDYAGARDILERNLLPNVMRNNMVSHVVQVRSHYAVVLAYCGEHDAADAEMAKLGSYEAGLDERHRTELINQRNIIVRLRTEPPPPQWQFPKQGQFEKAKEMASTFMAYRSREEEAALRLMAAQRRSSSPQREKGRRSEKIGRNAPCPCGSGKKFKRCHGIDD
jgi:hypothetical protein